MKKKSIKILLKFFVSGIFLSWIVVSVQWVEVWENVKKISVPGLVAYVVIILLGILISAFKWRLIANYKNIRMPLWELYKLYLTGSFINNFMPSFIGGDTYRAYQIGKYDNKYAEAASTVVMDRITGFVGSAALSLVFAAINFEAIKNNKVLMLVYLLIILSFVFDIVVAKSKRVPFLRNLVRKIVPEKMIQFLRELDGYNNNSKTISKAIALSSLFAMVGVALANFILFRALGINIHILDYLSVIFLISILAAVPVSINNIGVKEWAYINFFGYFGVSPAQAVTVAIINRFLQMIISFAAIPAFLKERRLSKKERLEN